MTGKRFYLTTAIDYANGDPHLGHALEKIGADAIARFNRMAGRDVHFLVGMDEHGQKVAQAAEAQGVAPQAYVDAMAARFRSTWDALAISYDQFIRTTDAPHKAGVRALIERIASRRPGDFYEKAYEGWYCVGCELFKRDAEIENGHCVLHPTRTLEWTQEHNWFFKLSGYQEFITRLLQTRPGFLQPESRRNEILALLAQGLEDISITRSRLSWAIPFPIPISDATPQGTWVWFDALPNYLTATGYPDGDWDTRWPAQLHVIGKDITRLHCVIWPAMLEAAGLPLPEHVWAHGFCNFGGERLSKSAGVKVSLDDTIARYGPDALRYYLLRDVPFDGDGNFSWERFAEVYDSELANTLGNLASRTIAMVEKFSNGVVPAAAPNAYADAAAAAAQGAQDGILGGDYRLNEAIALVMSAVRGSNEYVQLQQPWALAKDPAKRAELDATLWTLVYSLACYALSLAPVIPGKSQELWRSLGGPGNVHDQRWDRLTPPSVAGWQVVKTPPLFPKAEPTPSIAP